MPDQRLGSVNWSGPLLPRPRPSVPPPDGRTGSEAAPGREPLRQPVGRSGTEQMRELLQSLRGREVALQVGLVRVVGRLITIDPVVVVGAGGSTTLVRTEKILSIEF